MLGPLLQYDRIVNREGAMNSVRAGEDRKENRANVFKDTEKP